MKLCFFTECISPHQLPLAKKFIEVIGKDNFTYVYTDELSRRRRIMGWGDDVDSSWCKQGDATDQTLIDADVVISGLRAIGLFENRNKLGKVTYYCSERWFKPPLGFLRLFFPSYFKMAKRFVKTLESPYMNLLPMGIHASRDMLRLIGVMSGDWRCIFRAPKVAFESRPGGVVIPLDTAIKKALLSRGKIQFAKKYGFVQINKRFWDVVKPVGVYNKIRIWGYFVAESKGDMKEDVELETNKVLWVGRMLKWKRPLDLIKACSNKIRLSFYGNGPQWKRLNASIKGKKNITVNDFVPIEKVRDLMRQNNVYVLSSNGYEGWGAVVNEALEEGMKVVGTIEAGATATILPPSHLYMVGDVKRLRCLLSDSIEQISIGEWSVKNMAKVFEDMNFFLRRS
jgi:glycosyltransferase involved in cell wall biosynthesis